VTEAWGQAGDVMTLPVGFTYDEMQVTGADSGSVVDGRGGANGLLIYLSSINTFTQAIKGLKRPRSIQDAINQVTNVSTILKKNCGSAGGNIYCLKVMGVTLSCLMEFKKAMTGKFLSSRI